MHDCLCLTDISSQRCMEPLMVRINPLLPLEVTDKISMSGYQRYHTDRYFERYSELVVVLIKF
jgi:hypothetical protein